MKFIILGTIIVVHLVVLGLMLGPCHPEKARPEKPVVKETPGGGTPPVAPPPAPSSVQPVRPAAFGPGFYSEAPGTLPAALAAAAQNCRAAIVVDWSARTVLWKKQDETAVPIASLTKMMTVLLVMENMEQDPAITLETPIRVTREANRIGGREVWLDVRETFTLDEMLKCTLIFSANDAAYLLGQFLAGGDCAVFVERMNRRARELGMGSLTFHNPNGLPEGAQRLENRGSARDISYLAGRLLDYPQVLKWSQTRSEALASPLRKPATMLTSTNHLLDRVAGVNGMKTGYTDAAGWCMAATCERNGRVVIVVVTGCEKADARNSLVAGLIEWAYGRG